MHLVSCSTPPQPLEEAPRSALLAEPADGEQWDAFWSADAYVVRCTTQVGVKWFCVADDESTATSEPRVLTLRPKSRFMSRVTVVVAQAPDGRRMLVGGTGRRSGR